MDIDGLSGVELRHLRALLAVRETSSFSRAAVQLGYAQSAVSQQIAALERAVGVSLVQRPGGPRPVSLTEAGEMLARHAERVESHLAAASADLRALAAGETGCVRIGIFQSAGARVLPEILAEYRERRPRVEIELVERRDDRRLLDLVTVGSLDVSFGVLYEDDPPDPRLVHRVLLEDPFVLLAPPRSPLARRASVSLRELAGVDLIAAGTCPVDLSVENAFTHAGATRTIVFRTDDNLTMQRLVGAGLGHAVVPELTVERGPHAGPAVVIPLVDPPRPRRIAIFGAANRYRSPAVRSFIETAAAAFAEEPVAA